MFWEIAQHSTDELVHSRDAFLQVLALFRVEDQAGAVDHLGGQRQRSGDEFAVGLVGLLGVGQHGPELHGVTELLEVVERLLVAQRSALRHVLRLDAGHGSGRLLLQFVKDSGIDKRGVAALLGELDPFEHRLDVLGALLLEPRGDDQAVLRIHIEIQQADHRNQKCDGNKRSLGPELQRAEHLDAGAPDAMVAEQSHRARRASA